MKIFAKNKRAKFDYELIKKYDAGISLLGHEVKSIKKGDVDITSSYVYIDSDDNAQLINANIQKYEFQSIGPYDPKRSRQLLLNKKEIYKIKNEIQQKKLTAIPYKIYATRRGLIKLEFYLAKGKTKGDKREHQKITDSKREIKNYI